MTISTKSLLDVAGAAAYLGVSLRQVYRLRETEDLPVVRIGRRILFERDALDRFVERCREEPVIEDRCAAKIREVMSLAPIMTSTQRAELAALLVREVDVA
jgi:excisionase family DNA binding protein